MSDGDKVHVGIKYADSLRLIWTGLGPLKAVGTVYKLKALFPSDFWFQQLGSTGELMAGRSYYQD